MKTSINEELNYMKYLFGYQKGRVISEQYNPQLTKDGCEKEYYRDCTTKLCVVIPKNTKVVYTQEDFNKYKKILDISKKRNVDAEKYIKKWELEKYDKLEWVITDLSGNDKVYNKNADINLGLIKKQYWHNGDGWGTVTYKIFNLILACIETPVPISATTVSSSGTTEPPVGPPPPPIEDPKPIEVPKPTVNPNYPEYSLQYKKKKYLDVKLPKNKLKSVFDRGVLNTPGRFKISEKDPKEIARYVKYYEGYDDDQGNHIPGEIEKAQQQNRQIRFLDPVSDEDELAQQSYKEDYAEYKKIK